MDSDSLITWNLNFQSPEELDDKITSLNEEKLKTILIQDDFQYRIMLFIEDGPKEQKQNSENERELSGYRKWLSGFLNMVSYLRIKPIAITIEFSGCSMGDVLNEEFVKEMYTHRYFVWPLDSGFTVEKQTTPHSMEVIMNNAGDTWLYYLTHQEYRIINCKYPKDCLLIGNEVVQSNQRSVKVDSVTVMFKTLDMAASVEESIKHLILMFEPIEISMEKEPRPGSDSEGLSPNDIHLPGFSVCLVNSHHIKITKDHISEPVTAMAEMPQEPGGGAECADRCLEALCWPCGACAAGCLMFGPFVCCLPCICCCLPCTECCSSKDEQ